MTAINNDNHNYFRLAGFVGDSIVDGPGLRCTIFVQGCSHHCEGCHNPETWIKNAGELVSIEEMLNRIQKYSLCKGVTLSGGEPFEQAGSLVHLSKRLKQENYEIAAYTGYTFEALLQGTKEQQALLQNIDILIDGPFIQAQKNLNLRFRGSNNQRILNVPKSILDKKAVLEKSIRWTGEKKEHTT